jgi:hypothetical protein
MAMDRSDKNKRLSLLLRGGDSAPKVPLATLSQLGYKPPNSDGSSKSCGNCVSWSSDGLVCHLHDETETVTAKMICNHHVFGAVDSMTVTVTDPLTPKTSGLQLAGSCGECKWYRKHGKRDGECLASVDESMMNDGPTHPIVLADGVCNRFEE